MDTSDLSPVPVTSMQAALVGRRLTKEVVRQQFRNGIVAIREEAAMADHLRRSGLIAGGAARTADISMLMVETVRQRVDGDPLRSAVATPFVDDALQAIRRSFRTTTGLD